MLSRIKRAISGYKELKYLAYHDSLTGLLNRNWLNKNINNISYSYVYFIDINDLYKINKNGHEAGDEYIKTIVGIIRKTCIGKSDIFIRYAGDEFILFSHRNNALETNELFSVGISSIKTDVLSAINEADKDMLKSKQKFKYGD
ncbi:GGDEF domain-containing protein [Dolichospermum sp. ST_sed3]|nr:GGDEF domain-containing protein [Dolichospermum sp. ST_sed3]